MKLPPLCLRATVSVASLAALLFVSAAGCEVSVSSVCDAYCDCVGCTDSEFDSCVTDNEAGISEAREQGCTEEADAYLNCVDDEFQCVEDEAEITGCNRTLDKLTACAGVVVGFGGCELGVRKLEECLGEGGGSQFNECTPDVECTLTCVALATCEEIQMGSTELNNCFSECTNVTVPGPVPAPPPTDGGSVPPSPGKP